MKISNLILCIFVGLSISAPANATSWSPLKKGACDETSGKRAFKAKLKRNFGDEAGSSLCPRLHKTVNGKSRVPDRCEKKSLGGYTGVWLVADENCAKEVQKPEKTPKPRLKGS